MKIILKHVSIYKDIITTFILKVDMMVQGQLNHDSCIPHPLHTLTVHTSKVQPLDNGDIYACDHTAFGERESKTI